MQLHLELKNSGQKDLRNLILKILIGMKGHHQPISIQLYLQIASAIPIQILRSHQPHPLLQDPDFPEARQVVEVAEAVAVAGNYFF